MYKNIDKNTENYKNAEMAILYELNVCSYDKSASIGYFKATMK